MPFGRDIGRRADVVAQAVERELELIVGHGEAARPRPCEEVRHIGVEPGVVASGRPQSERALGALPRKDDLDCLGDALIDAGIVGDPGAGGEFAQIEQRQRPAHDLLGAAERIAVERRDQRRNVERRRRRNR
jgi:hypothetical protein